MGDECWHGTPCGTWARGSLRGLARCSDSWRVSSEASTHRCASVPESDRVPLCIVECRQPGGAGPSHRENFKLRYTSFTSPSHRRPRECGMLEHMGTSLFVTIAVMTVIVAITAGLFAHGRSPRTLLAGIGVALLPLGLFLTGMSDLLVSGVESLIAWVDRTGWTNTMSWGAGIGGLGILLIAVARSPRPNPRSRREASRPPRPLVPPLSPAGPPPGRTRAGTRISMRSRPS